jgi:CheY-like chemotaxis protein
MTQQTTGRLRPKSETSDPEPAAPSGRQTQPLRILLIDDDEDYRSAVKQLLESLGNKVTAVENGSEGLTVFMKDKDAFDVVLVDFYMPELDGARTLEWLRQIQSSVKTIIVSAADPLHLRQLAARHGADGFLGKPVTVEELSLEMHKVTDKTGEPSP